MAARTYRVGIVGAGEHVAYSSEVHSLRDDPSIPVRNTVVAGHAASLALMPNVEVIGICDLDPERTQRFKRNWSGKWPDLRLYSDYKEMLRSEDIDILTVATPDPLHADVAVHAAGTGVKGILCEKPIATSLSDADRIIEACESNGVVLTVDHTKRWTAFYHEVREAVRSGAIGRVGTIVATLAGRKMLFRDGAHVIDAICFFAESDPVKVSAVVEEGFESWDRYRGSGIDDQDGEPGASGFIQFANGIRALYCGTGGTFPGTWLQISGPKGQVHVDAHEESAYVMTGNVEVGGVQRRNLIARPFQVQRIVAAYHERIGLIERGGEGVSSGREARKTLQIILGFLKSHQEGGKLVPVPEAD